MTYIKHGTLPIDLTNVSLMKIIASLYSISGGTLYRRGLPTPMLECPEGEECTYALAEIHEDIFGKHLEARALGMKVLRYGCYRPSIIQDTIAYLKKICEVPKAHRYSNCPSKGS